MPEFRVFETVEVVRQYIVEAETKEEAQRLVEEGEVEQHREDITAYEVNDIDEVCRNGKPLAYCNCC